MRRTPESLEPREVLAEIEELQGELQERLVRVLQLAQSLRSRVRRAPVDDNTAVYLRCSNVWARFAGAASQGMQRTARTVRVVQQLERQPPQAPVAVKPPPEPPVTSVSPMDALIAAYGEEGQQ